MNVYQTDTQGYLIGTTIADQDPKEPDNWLIPRGCVTVVPPATGNEQIARWNGTGWEIVPDLRGRVYWLADRSRHEILERGVSLPAGALDAEPPKPLNEVKTTKLVELDLARQAAETSPVTVNGKTYNPSDSVTNLLANLGARLRRGKPTTLNALYEINGQPVSPVTSALVENIEEAITAQRETAWNHYGSKIAAVAAATTVSEVEQIVW